mgnify:CR=1 FL=1
MSFEGILSDIKVLDFSTLLPGPLATLFLSEMGAEVIKVERLKFGDEMRRKTPEIDGTNVSFAILNRGKKSIEIDLKNDLQNEKLKTLIKDVDIVLEQFRPGVMKRLGLNYDKIKLINPKIIYVSITGYGQEGPKSNFAGHDLNYIGDTGLLSLSMGKEDNTVVPPALIADIGAGSYPAIMNILLALRKRDLNKEGSYIDISMTDGLFTFMFWALGKGFSKNEWSQNSDYYLSGGSPRYNIYETKDNKYLALGALEDKFWKKFCEIIKAPKDVVLEKLPHNTLIKKVQSIIKKKNESFWKKKFDNENDVCCTAIKSLKEFMQDKHIRNKKLFDSNISMSGKEIFAIPTALDRKLVKMRKKNIAPVLGADNNMIKIL